MDRLFVGLAAVFGFLSVALGAFGAHGLKDRLSPDMMTVYQTAVQYHQIHALALFAVAWLVSRPDMPSVATAGWLFTAGILIFSGTLYALAVTGIKILGAITPIGGLALMAGWGWIFFCVWKAGISS